MKKATNTVFGTNITTVAARGVWALGLSALALTDMASAVAFVGFEETIITTINTMPSTLA